MGPNFKSISRTKTQPLAVPRTIRNHDLRVLTSLPAGKMVPIAAIPLLREDAVTRGNLRLSFEMMETAEILMNAVNVNAKAYLVPNLAFERFSGMDELNRAYEGIANPGTTDVTPYIEREAMPAHGVNKILYYMGKHAKPGTMVNTAYVEAYNAIWNFRARNRSPDITLRERLKSDTLAPAFWQHQGFAHIVPDFDQAVIDGEVPLSIVDQRVPVTGLGVTGQPDTTNASVKDSSNRLVTFAHATGTSQPNAFVKMKASVLTDPAGASAWIPDVFAELQDGGITVSLANIELAKKTQAFARARAMYTGHSDEFIIDLLMDGISVPEQQWRQPILLADRSTIFGMSKRYATDSGNLTDSVVTGLTYLDIPFIVPRVPTGGVIMIVAEITPEQLFERQKDPYLHLPNVGALPQYLRDELDPEKVSIVTNDYIDIDHDTPDGTFGYAPLNHEWNHAGPCIGGRFYRPEVDAGFDEDRQRIWAVETQNPVLSEDFYLCTTMHTKPFVVTNQDPFEVVGRGGALISGNTVFGGYLVEANNDYAEVIAEAPLDRIEKPKA